ncbi:MAG TPA: hypothetical protein DCY13_18040 [Verrucomicrobiales bacterium]|nr:hypothetical protein [Verrucomicrobiales bacterium]
MTLPTHEEHHDLGARFTEVNGMEVVGHYGDVGEELRRLQSLAAVLDFSFRSRLVVVGADRTRFLHSQCTNDINRLKPGQGCYTAVTNNKGRVQGDANVFVLPDEILLDAEPGQTAELTGRFQKFVVSDDIEVIDAAPHYGLLTVQGPRTDDVIGSLGLDAGLPAEPFAGIKIPHPVLGEIYLACHPRLALSGADFFVPVASLGAMLDKLIAATQAVGGGVAGWDSFEHARVEAGIPRFGVDMTETNLAPEAGIGSRAISYTKGCYVGQEILNRLRTFAEVSRRLCRLQLTAGVGSRPAQGAKLTKDGREAGWITSVGALPESGKLSALGYVRKEWQQPGTPLQIEGGGVATVVAIIGA